MQMAERICERAVPNGVKHDSVGLHEISEMRQMSAMLDVSINKKHPELSSIRHH